MTDRDLLSAIASARELERTFEQLAKTTADLAERDQVLNAFRRARPLRQSLETWLAVRQLRADLVAKGMTTARDNL